MQDSHGIGREGRNGWQRVDARCVFTSTDCPFAVAERSCSLSTMHVECGQKTSELLSSSVVLHFRPPDAQSFAPLFQGLVWFNVSDKGPLLFSTCGRGLHRGECRGFCAFSPVGCRVRCGASDERSRPRRVFPVRTPLQMPSCPSSAGRLGLTIIPQIVPQCVRGC